MCVCVCVCVCVSYISVDLACKVNKKKEIRELDVIRFIDVNRHLEMGTKMLIISIEGKVHVFEHWTRSVWFHCNDLPTVMEMEMGDGDGRWRCGLR